MDEKKVAIRDRISDDEKNCLVKWWEIKRNQQHWKTRNRILWLFNWVLNLDWLLKIIEGRWLTEQWKTECIQLRNLLFTFTPQARDFRRNKEQNNILENVTLHMKSDSTILDWMKENEYLKHLGENSSILKVKELCNTPIDEEDENTFFTLGIKFHGSERIDAHIPIQDIYQIDVALSEVTEDRWIITRKAKEIMRNLKEKQEKEKKEKPKNDRKTQKKGHSSNVFCESDDSWNDTYKDDNEFGQGGYRNYINDPNFKYTLPKPK